MTTTALPAGFRRTLPRDLDKVPYTSTYATLLVRVKEAGLLRRSTAFYGTLFGGLTAALGALMAGFILLAGSWYQLLIAAALGIVFTQFAFIAHEAAHRQVLKSGRHNDGLGRAIAAFVVGLSYSWWMSKHSRHHANPNMVGKDPDIDADTISFYEAVAAPKRGFARWLVMRQGYLFFPLLFLEGLNLHIKSTKSLFERRSIPGRWVELSAIAVRFALYFGLVFGYLPFGLAMSFIAIQLSVFGFYMGASFAPNHKGMPILDGTEGHDFLTRQVLTSRNISGGLPSTALMGGLNYQVEHHLFPNMPRPHLRRAQVLVREYCEHHGIEYTETTLMKSYGMVVRYLNRVGLAARDPFHCPVVAQTRLH